jgi:DNA-binding CsgD family transcriptional regulator
MRLPDYIRHLGPRKFAKVVGVKERTALSWMYLTRYPNKRTAQKIVERTPADDGRDLRFVTREEIMEHLFRDGRTLESIGRLYELSRERIRQILNRRGVTAEEGGGRVKSDRLRETRWHMRKSKRDERCQKHYQCSYEVALSVNGGRNLSDSSSPCKAYRDQRRSAASRGIEWQFTLPEWWKEWQLSGKWPIRGRGKYAYCMSRKGDNGAYAPGNVSIITISQNCSDSFKTKPSKTRRSYGIKELTPRQKEIATLSARGLTAKDISKELNIKRTTVMIQLCSIKRKAGIYAQLYPVAAAV